MLNPATGQLLAKVPNCGGAETRAAIDAAAAQFAAWGRRPGKERAGILRRCAVQGARAGAYIVWEGPCKQRQPGAC